MEKEQHPSDSSFQLNLEKSMVEAVLRDHPSWQIVVWQNISAELGLGSIWQNARPDGAWQDEDGCYVIAECYAHVGKLKPGHRRKIAMDVLKMLSLRNAVISPKSLCCLLIVPEDVNNQLQAEDWFSIAIHQAVEVVSIQLTPEEQQKLQETVAHQSLGQARTSHNGAK